MNSYQKVLDDLMQVFPTDVECCPIPYEEAMSAEEKFQVLMEAVGRSDRLGSRILKLSNAFYLGQFLEKKVRTKIQRDFFVRQLSEHYRTTSLRVYYIFETPGVIQIMRTTKTSLTMIRNLSLNEYQDLVAKSLEIFSGVENLGADDVMIVRNEQ